MGNSAKLATLEPEFRTKTETLLAELAVRGVNCAITSARRTMAEQAALYAQGRNGNPGQIVTKAQAGQSPHNYGLAADLCPLHPKDGALWWNAPDDVWNLIHVLAEEHGVLDSGFDWKFVDRPHVEDPNWRVQMAAWKRGEVTLV